MAESCAQDRDGVDRVDTTARECELASSPIDGRIVVLEPVKPQNDGVSNRNNT